MCMQKIALVFLLKKKKILQDNMHHSYKEQNRNTTRACKFYVL